MIHRVMLIYILISQPHYSLFERRNYIKKKEKKCRVTLLLLPYYNMYHT